MIPYTILQFFKAFSNWGDNFAKSFITLNTGLLYKRVVNIITLEQLHLKSEHQTSVGLGNQTRLKLRKVRMKMSRN